MIEHSKSISVKLRSGAPGRGKTHELLHNNWKHFKGRCLYFTHSHQTCEEKYYELGGKPYVRHIKGLKSCCPCWKKKFEERSPKEQIIANLVEYNFSNKIICGTCKRIRAYPQRKCRYKKQFVGIKNCHIVVTVIQCAYGPNLFNKFEPDYVAMDDCLDLINPQQWKDDIYLQYIRLLNRAKIRFDKYTQLEKISEKNFSKIVPKLEKAFRQNITKLTSEIKKNDTLSYAKHYLIPPAEIEDYFKMAKLYGFRKRFATPAFFYLFDYIVKQKEEGKNVQLMLIDARQPHDLLAEMKKRYHKEKGVVINFENDSTFVPLIVEQNSVVYKMGHNDAWYPEQSMRLTKTQARIKETIEWILYHFFNKNYNLKIGVVTRKPSRKWVNRYGKTKAMKMKLDLYIPEGYKNVKVETYGNLRGQNTLKDCKTLFVLGSYGINKSEMKQMVSDWFCCDPTTMEKVEEGAHGGYYHYIDGLAEILRKRREEYEMYQAIHRVRPLLETKLIFAFSYVPEKELKEDGLEVKRITKQKIFEKNKERTEWLEDFVRANGKISRVEAEEAFAKQFHVKEKWAYREILKIVRNSEHLGYRNHILEYL